ncbi:signal recognition particle protein [Spiroplasma endosymbiont of Amphibalanus improvisus]|uniref:signal recognition particle protein n=1 Tax=Spiroplasma endosymbiont of Amphibalanus improvisus TaxID=3066327 RepID=UPI00313EA83F
MFGNFLAKRLNKSITKNLNKSTLNDNSIDKAIDEIRLVLLESDVNNEVVKDLIKNIRKKAEGQFILKGLKPSEMLIKIVHEEIIDILGKNKIDINFHGNPSIVMMVGLQGSGKTTTTGKIANLVAKKYSKKPLLVACDIYRPAAIEQLKVIGNKLNIPVFEKGTQDPVKTTVEAVEYAKKNNHDLVLFDTAGRLHIDEKLMNELKQIQIKTKPQEILLVVDGMTGQDIINVTKSFNDLLKLSGVVVTKLDGDERGGVVLSIRHLTGLPIKFIGTGENTKDIEFFYPDRMADRLLGLGDVKTLVEKVQENVDERTFKDTMQRMMSGQFDLQDLLNQMRQIGKMGKLGGIAKMIPGAPKIDSSKIVDGEKKLRIAEILITSMTMRERREPRLLKHLSRKERIIKGSGRTLKEYNELINQFEKTKKQVDLMVKNLRQGRMPNIPGMGGLGGLGF